MQKLNLPEYKFRIQESEGKLQIFDSFRKKLVALTPEEWVRQNFLMFLVSEKNYPKSLITVEAALRVVKRSKRTDIVVYGNKRQALLIVECKAPSVNISQDTFDQIVRYNISLQVNYLLVTNGLEHFCCKLNYKDNTYVFLKDIPDYYVLT